MATYDEVMQRIIVKRASSSFRNPETASPHWDQMALGNTASGPFDGEGRSLNQLSFMRDRTKDWQDVREAHPSSSYPPEGGWFERFKDSPDFRTPTPGTYPEQRMWKYPYAGISQLSGRYTDYDDKYRAGLLGDEYKATREERPLRAQTAYSLRENRPPIHTEMVYDPEQMDDVEKAVLGMQGPPAPSAADVRMWSEGGNPWAQVEGISPAARQTILDTANSEQQIENLIEIYGLSAVESVLTSAPGRGNNYGRQ